jgi:parvulin-like peptidyl-prolyl isomerase
LSSPFQLLSPHALEGGFRQTLENLRDLPPEHVLERHGLLRPLAREAVLAQVAQEVPLTEEEAEQIPEEALVDQVRLRKWLDEHYGPQVESHYLARRKDLERVVFRAIRLHQLGLAEELYLRLLDEEESFGDLAANHSLGEERFTRGLMGPMPISQPHPNIRAVLNRLEVGDVCPPFAVDQTLLILRLEHRIPAVLDEAMRQHLLQELMQPDLDAAVDSLLARWTESDRP